MRKYLSLILTIVIIFGLIGVINTSTPSIVKAQQPQWSEDYSSRVQTAKLLINNNNPNIGKLEVTMGTPVHYRSSTGNWIEIDNAFVPDVSPYYIKMEKDSYTTRIKETFSDGQIVDYENNGHHIFFQPKDWLWTNPSSQLELISTPQAVSANYTNTSYNILPSYRIDSGEVTWENAFGTGINFTQQTLPGRLSKLYTIADNSTLPEPPVYMGDNVSLLIDVIFNPDSEFDIFIDGYKWNKRDTVTTKERIRFEVNTETLFYFDAPMYWDSTEQFGLIADTVVEKRGNSLYISIKVPYSWLQQASYPVYIDPSVTVTSDADPETTTFDGIYNKSHGSGVSWSTLIDFGSASFHSSSTTGHDISIDALASGNLWSALARAIGGFDTSPLPNNAIITSANHSINIKEKVNDTAGYKPSIVMIAANVSSTTGSTATDYATIGDIRYSSTIDYDDTTVGQYSEFTLNAAGLATINVTGPTWFGYKLTWDADNNEPGWGANDRNRLSFWSADDGSGRIPYFQVDYTLPAVPTVVTLNATASETWLNLSGNITTSNGDNATERGFYINTGNYTESGSWDTGTFSYNWTGRTAGTAYYNQALAVNGQGVGIGINQTIATLPYSVTSLNASIASAHQVNLQWIKGIGSENTTVRYRTDGTFPTSITDGTLAYNGTDSSINITGLHGSPTLHISTWAINTDGITTYSTNTTNVIVQILPTVTSVSITAIQTESGLFTGNITSTNTTITEHGFQYGLNPGNYTLNQSTTGSFGLGTFTENISGLNPNTAYFWRAFAIDNLGQVVYGAELTFRTLIQDILYVEILPELNQTIIGSNGKPTSVSEGIVQGLSLPVWSTPVNQYEEILFHWTVPPEWNQSSNISVHITLANASAEVFKNYNFQLDWNSFTPDVDITPSGFNTLTLEHPTGNATAWQTHEIEFELDYTTNTTDFIKIEDHQSARLRRISASANESASEAVILHIGIHFPVDAVATTPIDTSNFIEDGDMEQLAVIFTLSLIALVFTITGLILNKQKIYGASIPFWIVLSFYLFSQITDSNVLGIDKWQGWFGFVSLAAAFYIFWDLFRGEFARRHDTEKIPGLEDDLTNYEEEYFVRGEKERVEAAAKKSKKKNQ